MSDREAKHPLASRLAGGVKDLPRNTSWLLSKALSPVEATKGAAQNRGSNATNGVVDAVRHAGVREGRDARLRRLGGAATSACPCSSRACGAR